MTRKPISALTAEEEARIQASIASDPDNPELTAEQMAMAKPFGEVFRPSPRPSSVRAGAPASLPLEPRSRFACRQGRSRATRRPAVRVGAPG